MLAIILFTILFMSGSGRATTTVAVVIPELEQGSGVASPAQKIGLKPGDRIVAIDGVRVKASDIPDRIAASEGRPMIFTVVRDGEELQLGPAAAQFVEGEGYRLGLGLKGTGLGLLAATKRSFEATAIVSREIFRGLGRLVTSEGRKDVSSPIGITQASSDAVEQGTERYLLVLGLISLSLALLNLLPLLPLDGGHILFALLEGARGRTLRREIYERVSVVGLAIVLLLFFVGVSNDIGRLS